jgi:transaldolase
MKIFVDTANVKEIRDLAAMGVLDGVTTNPTLMSKEDGDPFEILHQIASAVDGPVSAEVVALDHKTMLEEGRRLAGIHPNIMVKVPITPDGLRAVRDFVKEGIRTNVTLIFSANQALLAARAGATFVSPFLGRLDDGGQDGMELVHEIVAIYRNYDFATQVLAASIRSSRHVTDAALAGAHAATIPPKVLRQLFNHSLTEKGLAQFLADWEKVGVKI